MNLNPPKSQIKVYHINLKQKAAGVQVKDLTIQVEVLHTSSRESRGDILP